MLRVEFHCHTIYSKDSLTTPRRLLETCQKKGLDRVVITDHNCIGGALEARAIDPQRVIVGEEIMTSAGELLAAFVREEIPPGLPPLETIRLLRDQSAFISVSHPFDALRSGAWKLEDLLEIVPHIDAIETFNARCLRPDSNQRAEAFARAHGLPGTAGSDAHAPSELGQATLLLPDFNDARSLLASLPLAEPRLALSAPWVHFYSRYAVWWKKWARRRKARKNKERSIP